MNKRDALLCSLAELKAAHESAGMALSIVINTAAKTVKGQEVVPTIADLKRYKKSIAAARSHALQAEMVLIEYMQPPLPLEDLNFSFYLQ